MRTILMSSHRLTSNSSGWPASGTVSSDKCSGTIASGPPAFTQDTFDHFNGNCAGKSVKIASLIRLRAEAARMQACGPVFGHKAGTGYVFNSAQISEISIFGGHPLRHRLLDGWTLRVHTRVDNTFRLLSSLFRSSSPRTELLLERMIITARGHDQVERQAGAPAPIRRFCVLAGATSFVKALHQ